MQLYLKYSKEKIKLANKPFAGGGEGHLYKILSPKPLVGYVAKIYHPEKRTTQRKEKIQYLYENPPEGLQDGQHPAFIWVSDILYDEQKNFMGFIMPFIKGEKLEVLSSAKLPKQLGNEWKRFDMREPKAFELRMRVCFNLAAAVYHIHNSKRYVIVDLKPENIIIQPNGLISLVDMDSIEVVEQDKVVFPAPVATPEYTPPEHYRSEARSHQLDGIDTHWDMFALAVIFYKLLFGLHPYAASAKAPYDSAVSLHEKIQHGLFVHHPGKQEMLAVVPPPHKAFYSKLTEELKTLFYQSFVEGDKIPDVRPAAEDWCMALLHAFGDEKMIAHFQNLFRYSGYRGRNLKQPSVITKLPAFTLKPTELIPNEFYKILAWVPPTPTPKLPAKPIKLKFDLNNARITGLSIATTATILTLLLFFHSGFYQWFFGSLWEQSSLKITITLQLVLLIPLLLLPLMFMGLRYFFDKKVMAWNRLKRISHKVLKHFGTYRDSFLELKGTFKEKLDIITDEKPLMERVAAENSKFKNWLQEQDEAFFKIRDEEQKAIDDLLKLYLKKLLKNPIYEGFKPKSFGGCKTIIHQKKQEALSEVHELLHKKKNEEIPEVKEHIHTINEYITGEILSFTKHDSEKMERLSQQEQQDIADLDNNLLVEADLEHKYKFYIQNFADNLRNVIHNLLKEGLSSILQIERVDCLRATLILKEGREIPLSAVAEIGALSLAFKLNDWCKKIVQIQQNIADEKLRIQQYYKNLWDNALLEKEKILSDFDQRIKNIAKDAIHLHVEARKTEINKSFAVYEAEIAENEQNFQKELNAIKLQYEQQYQVITNRCETVAAEKQAEMLALEKEIQGEFSQKFALSGLEKVQQEGLEKIKILEKMVKEAELAEENYLKYNI